MRKVICNTSPLQYLHQLGHLDLLPNLVSRVVVPTAVAAELAEGRRIGLDLPVPENLSWVDLCEAPVAPLLPLVAALGPGETAVLALALAAKDVIVILDDALARRQAETMGLRLTGTLGILLDAKRAGLISAIAPLADDLQRLGFRLSGATRQAVLALAGEVKSGT